MSWWIGFILLVGFAAFALIGWVRPWPKVTWGYTRVRVSRLGYAGILLFLIPMAALLFVEYGLHIDPGGPLILTAIGIALGGWVLTFVAGYRDTRRSAEYQARLKGGV